MEETDRRKESRSVRLVMQFAGTGKKSEAWRSSTKKAEEGCC
jgi:hypothetical protein